MQKNFFDKLKRKGKKNASSQQSQTTTLLDPEHQTTQKLNTQATIAGNSNFAFELYAELRKMGGNLFFSPHSISTALAMTYAGARENTADQMAQALHFIPNQTHLHTAFAQIEASLNSLQDNEVNSANALWPQIGYPLLEEFVALLTTYYATTITPVDYQTDPESARQAINAWVESKTKDKIKNLLQPGVLDALTRLVLVNAIYFKGVWANKFDKTATRAEPFWVTTENSMDVPMMHQTRQFNYRDSNHVQILELPYVGDKLSMVVLLPKKIDGLANLEKELTLSNVKKWLHQLRATEVNVTLPKFKLDAQFQLNQMLQSLGITDAFDEAKANFAGIDGQEAWLYIAAVIHQAFVNVDEEGTEAAAATAVIFKVRAMPTPPPVFKANHPFIFLIRDNETEAILFMGRVAEPH